MEDDVSRVLGIEGMAVTGVSDHGWWVELEVEILARARCCRWCGRGSLKVMERDAVRVRDLPLAGRITYLCWRKRRFGCEGCGRTFTETHPALASRQRVSARFRARHPHTDPTRRARGPNTQRCGTPPRAARRFTTKRGRQCYSIILLDRPRRCLESAAKRRSRQSSRSEAQTTRAETRPICHDGPAPRGGESAQRWPQPAKSWCSQQT